MNVTTRFAPSPTGLLHLGHVHAAGIAHARARAAGGTFLLRLEDIDPQRCRPDFAEAILRDLAWLGLHWDGAVRRQSAHLPAYAAAIAQLSGQGLAYPCFCSRADIRREAASSASAPHTPDGAPRYAGTCRAVPAAQRAARLSRGDAHVWRLDMHAALARAPRPMRFHDAGRGWVTADPAPFGDVVLGRRDAPASYHLCVTHDDALQGVTLVTRGEDLRAATHLHVLLQAVMGWPVPAYEHHGLLTGADGARLSKRDGAAAIAALRAAGGAPGEVLRLAGLAPGAAARQAAQPPA